MSGGEWWYKEMSMVDELCGMVGDRPAKMIMMERMRVTTFRRD